MRSRRLTRDFTVETPGNVGQTVGQGGIACVAIPRLRPVVGVVRQGEFVGGHSVFLHFNCKTGQLVFSKCGCGERFTVVKKRSHPAQSFPPVPQDGVFRQELGVGDAFRGIDDGIRAAASMPRKTLRSVVLVDEEETFVTIFRSNVHRHRVLKIAVDLPGMSCQLRPAYERSFLYSQTRRFSTVLGFNYICLGNVSDN